MAVCPGDLTCQFTACRSPATAVPSQLWGDLKPVDLGTLPAGRDTTDWDEFQGPFSNAAPHWMTVDAEGGWLFTAINFGLEIWDARGPLAAAPTLETSEGGSAFPVWINPGSHESNPVRDLDVPDGNDDLVAVAIADNVGLTVFNTAAKGNPRAVYADHDKQAVGVYSGTIGGRHYAFLATLTDGLLAYDMSTAQNNAVPCVEQTPGQQSCGVYRGKVGSRNDVRYVDGVGNFVALSSGNFDFGVELWDVSNPAAPVLRIDGLTGQLGVHGPAMWQRAGKTYLSVRVRGASTTEARIYDVSCLTGGSCGGLGAPIWTATLAAGASEYFTTHSTASGGREFLYFGSSDRCNQAIQNEWLYDVTAPAVAFDVTPAPDLVSGALTGYWGWYYRRNPTGFNRVTPRSGVFAGKYFYRAAYTVFDVHELNVNDLFSDGFESGNTNAWSTLVP